jgi:putative peptidoglycan lipid II flippase
LSLFKSGLIVASLTFLSRIFGLIRELVIANFFGTNIYADAINTAFKFPNLFRRIFGEGALASVFVPIYASELQENKIKADFFASQIFTLLLISLVGLTILIEIFMPQILTILAPGFISDPLKFTHSVLLCRITIPYMIFISLAALIGSIENSHNRFASFAFVPIILNIFVIISCFFGENEEKKTIFVSIGILAGGIFQFIFMYVIARFYGIKLNLSPLKKLSRDSILFFKNMIPATIASSVTQLNLFVSQAIASFAPGAISILSYSDRIYQFPLSIIGICFGTVLLPSLSAHYKNGDIDAASNLQTQAIKLSLFLSLACMFGIITLAHPIMHVIYERGAFTSSDTIKTAETIAIFALGLPAFILNKVLTPILFSKLDTRTPMKLTTITIVINIALNALLIKDFEHLGIALGTIISAWINIFLIVRHFRIRKINLLTEKIGIYVLKLLGLGVIMSICVLIASSQMSDLIYKSHGIVKFMSLSMVILFGFIIYFGAALYIKLITKDDIKKILKRR